jgi:outer membrane protein assembly factor BamB
LVIIYDFYIFEGGKNMKRVGIILICIILILNVYTSTASLDKLDFSTININFFESTTADDWPMFHHDLWHTGYSASSAPSSNNLLWIYTAGQFNSSSPVIYNGKVYVGSADYKLHCLNAGSGEWIWDYSTTAQIMSTPAVANGKVYIGSIDNKIYCLNAETGEWIWEYTTGSIIVSSPTVYNGKVYIASYDNKLYCLNADTGAWIWEYDTGSYVISSAAIASNKVYIGSDKLYCLNVDTGAWIWEYDTGSYLETSPAIYNDKVYFGSLNEIYCLNADTGTWIWDYTTDGSVGSCPAIGYNKVYFGSFGGKVYCLDANSGAWVWEYNIGDWVFSSPAVADDKLYVGAGDSKIYCLNANTGLPIWSYTIGRLGGNSPAIANNKLYMLSDEGNMYCFGSDSNLPPSVNIIYPQNDYIVSGLITINGTAYDPNGDNDLKEIQVDTGSGFQKATGTSNWTFIWNTSEVEDGQHIIYAFAMDKKYEISTIEYVIVNVSNQNQPPNIEILSPKEDDIVIGIVNIYGSASDPNGNETLDHVEIRIDDKPWQNATGTNYWNYSWNTDNETDGIHTIKARSYDGELYSNDFFMDVTIQHDLPVIVIDRIIGGLGVTVDIKNNGTDTAVHLNWSIDVEASIGLILSGSHTERIITELEAGDSKQIQSLNLRGIGLITITIQVGDAEKQATAFLLGSLVLRVNEI